MTDKLTNANVFKIGDEVKYGRARSVYRVHREIDERGCIGLVETQNSSVYIGVPASMCKHYSKKDEEKKQRKIVNIAVDLFKKDLKELINKNVPALLDMGEEKLLKYVSTIVKNSLKTPTKE